MIFAAGDGERIAALVEAGAFPLDGSWCDFSRIRSGRCRSCRPAGTDPAPPASTATGETIRVRTCRRPG